MLEKTYRVQFLMNQFNDLTDIQKKLAHEMVKSFIEERQFFRVFKDDFEEFYGDTVTPAYAVESFCELNEMIAYPFKFELYYEDSEDWHIRACMINRVYNNLDSELD